MRKVMLIPTYWSRKKGGAFHEGDVVYDHPTPIDEEGTLQRTLESMKILTQRDFKLVLLVCPTAPEIAGEAEAQVIKIVEKSQLNVETYILTPADLAKMVAVLKNEEAMAGALKFFDMRGYANVRNMCLIAADILDAEVAILIDDDEVFEKEDFIQRSVEFIGKRVYGDVVHGIAGYYLNKKNQYYDDVVREPWMTYWDRFGAKAKAFDKIIGCGPRIKRTPFAFGGAMIIHSELFKCVPFDPAITRGEDLDYLINSKMYGFSFFLDNTLSIKHLPEPKKHPQWKRIREDIYRFVYEKAKITAQYETGNMVIVKPEDFDPYPGEFLKDDLEEKLVKANLMLSMQYMTENDTEGCRQALKNIEISKYEAPPAYDAFSRYRSVQKEWERIIKAAVEFRYELRKIMEAHNLSRKSIVRDTNRQRNMTKEEMYRAVKILLESGGFTKEDIRQIADISAVKTYFENEMIFSAGDVNDSVNIMMKGEAVIFACEKNKEPVEVARLKKNSVIGENCLAYETMKLNCRAVEFTEMLSIKKENLTQLLVTMPKLGVKILKLLLQLTSAKLQEVNKTMQEAFDTCTVADAITEEFSE